MSFALPGFAMLLLFANFFWRDASFTLEAQTRGVEIVVDGDESRPWLLPEATVCIRRPLDAPDKAGVPQLSDCDFQKFDAFELQERGLAWRSGTKLRITKEGVDAPAQIQVLAVGARDLVLDGRVVTPNSLILLSAEAWKNASVLTFKGELVIGAVPSPGSRDHLLSGSYSIRQALAAREKVIEVTRGVFFPGDRVEVVAQTAGDKPIIVEGFFGPATSDRADGIFVLGFSAAAPSRLQVDRLGAGTTYHSPAWMDRALQDPLLIGISTFLALFISLLEIPSRLRW